ncbi:hypothetical protein KAK06_10510 [Ideonella sp. 4Y11]|uniref:Uncharacterized protein n=1 Tax=Ideonella aquatica TaxID=2824119 RepID=A0A941BG25_9BURK|nr:hypothetical protein [Ideonella aquatica]MBQ0959381.1 hypothetical protein [Ideonella aquatica]
MWKIALGFIVFAGLAMFIIMKGGDKLDMSGEKHGSEAIHAPEGASAPASAPAAPVAASAASAG